MTLASCQTCPQTFQLDERSLTLKTPTNHPSWGISKVPSPFWPLEKSDLAGIGGLLAWASPRYQTWNPQKGPRPGRSSRTPRGGADTPVSRPWRPRGGPPGPRDRGASSASPQDHLRRAGRGRRRDPRRVEPGRPRWRWLEGERAAAQGGRLAGAGKRPRDARTPGAAGSAGGRAQARPLAVHLPAALGEGEPGRGG